MRLPQINLDDRTFQDLVNEARTRIAQRCPEWTEHNVSDPGITLIELFAWMTEILLYRLNRIPDKLQVALLELLGLGLAPPTPARTDLRFRLAAPPKDALRIPGATEVGTTRTDFEHAIVFQTDEDFVIPNARPIAYLIERSRAMKDVGVAGGVAKPSGPDQLPFSSPPVIGDALYLGFDSSLARLLLRIEVDCSQARGAGIDPEDPPLRWETSASDGIWKEAELLRDQTGGFNYGSGTVEVQIPKEHGIVVVGAKRAHWLRCRLDGRTRSGANVTYQNPPEIYSITAAPIGALIAASHSTREDLETLGTSDGTPGQLFRLRHSPVLALEEGETLEVIDHERGSVTRWELRESFVESDRNAPHFLLDLATGEVELGPAIRDTDASWRQFGAVPPKGATVRFTSYRHGGGRRGNVVTDKLTVLKGAIPGVSTVTNPAAALGGVDPESLRGARQRAGLELRTRYRAVTAEDFEFLCRKASPRVARASCRAPENGGPIRVQILPRVEPADRQLTIDELTPDTALIEEVTSYLDERRVIGTSIVLDRVSFRGVSVVVNVQASRGSDLRRIEDEVAYALYSYLNPLVGGDPVGPGEGWEFGRALNQGELYHVVHSVAGVEFVKILRIYETDLKTGEQEAKPAGSHIVLAPDELIASGRHIVRAELGG
jgi:predicted phage baseplate assembly protein